WKPEYAYNGVWYDGLNNDIPKGNSQFFYFLLDCFGLGIHSVGKEIMPSKFQPTRGGARRRNDKSDTMRNLRDENIDCKGEVHKSDEGDNSSADRSSSSSVGPNSDEGSDNEATSSSAEDTKPIREDIIKGKILAFRDSLR
ncbi:hypothetical protein HAX54_042000, partial [Datura stramonium]|nr:hypothetical protein [Datura stramonium]